jgi:hypothetical protein
MLTVFRLKRLIALVIGRAAGEEIVGELCDLSGDFDGVNGEANFREKIRDAVEWAEMLCGKRETTHDSDAIRGFLLQELGSAAEIAKELANGPT